MQQRFVGIIDGTGPWSDAEYAASMKNSFCRQMFEALGAPGSTTRESPTDGLVVETNGQATVYLRGPSGEGYFIEKRAKIIVDRAMAIGAGTIYLAGYSRGGSAAVIAAQMLADKGVPVTGLFLFDPVARHGSASSDVVPANVAAAFTARRAIGAPQMDKYDWALLGDLAGHNPVRNWFGTTATQFASPSTQRRDTVEVGSHGALGGVGWKGVSEDIPCQEAVARFFNQALREQQLPIQIESRTPVSSL